MVSYAVCFSVCLSTKGCLDNARFLLFSRTLAAAQKVKAQVVSKEIKKNVVLAMVCKDKERSGYKLRDKGPMSRNWEERHRRQREARETRQNMWTCLVRCSRTLNKIFPHPSLNLMWCHASTKGNGEILCNWSQGIKGLRQCCGNLQTGTLLQITGELWPPSWRWDQIRKKSILKFWSNSTSALYLH